MSRRDDDFYDFDYGSDDEEPTTPGAVLAETAAALGAWVGGLIVGLALAVGPVACIALDLLLGPQFIDSWTTTNGTPLNGLASPVPLAVSVAMTGLQYALFDRIKLALAGQGATRKAIAFMVLAGVIALADTAIDWGGVTSWFYSDAEAANIWPSEPRGEWGITSILVCGLCLFHEPVMQSLLARFKGKLADDSFRGAALIKGGLRAGSWSLNIVKAGALMTGAAAMFILDLILTPQMGTGGIMTFTMWAWSIACTAILYMVWQHYETVGVKRLKPIDRVYVGIGWGLAVIDTLADVVGFTTAIYGNGTEIVWIPERPTWVWGLGAVIIAAICFSGERMLREMLWRPRKGRDGDAGSDAWSTPKSSKKSKSKPKSDDDWGSDWDSGWGDDDAGSKKKDKKDKKDKDDDWGSGGDWI